MGQSGGPSGHKYNDRGFQAGLQNSTHTHPVSSSRRHHVGGCDIAPGTLPPRLAFKGSGSGNQNPRTASLLKALHETKEKWEAQARDRPISSEPPPCGSYLQDGDGGSHFKGHLRSPLGLFCGYRGCLFPCPHALGLPQVPRLPSPGENLCLPISTIRPLPGPVGFLQGDKAYQASSSHSSDHNFQLLRRLHYLRYISSRPQESDGGRAECSSTTRIQNQLGEVLSHSFPDGGISGCDVGSSGIIPVGPRGQERSDRCEVSGNVPQEMGNKKGTGEPDGLIELCRGLHPVGPSTSSSHTSMDKSPHFSREQGHPGPFRRGFQAVADALDGSSFPRIPSPLTSSASVSDLNDGCLPGGVVWDSSPAEDTGIMATRCGPPFNELEGIEGRSSLSVGVSRRPKGEGSSGAVRQHHGHCLPKTPGLGQTPSSPLPHVKDSSFLQRLEDKPSSCSSEGCSECSGRPGFSTLAHCNRVVSGQNDLLFSGVPGSSFPGGLVCNKGKLSASSICVSLPRPSSSGLRCIQLTLGSLDIHLPDAPFQLSAGCGPPAPELSREGCTDRPLLAIEGLVPPPTTSLPRDASPSSSESVSLSDDFEGPSDPPRLPLLESSRLASMMRPMVQAGLSDQSVEVFMRAHRPSTQKQYQMSWRKFLQFLRDKRIPHSAVTENVVINFLSHLLLSEDKAYRTILNYKCALQSPLQLNFNVDLKSPAVEFFLKGVFATAPPKSAPMASWSLDHLLSYLASEVFEPLHSKSLLEITKKTLCLVLLATGRRIDEVQHLSRLISWDESGELVTLHWLDRYVPKHYTKDFQPHLPVMERLSSDVLTDVRLCPVRALQTYLSKFTCSPRLLHKSPLWSQSTAELSSMLISTVNLARRFAGDMSAVPVGPHQMRKFAASYSAKMVVTSGLNVELLMERMGSCSMSVLNRTYIRKVPCLSLKAVVPVGTFDPALHIGT